MSIQDFYADQHLDTSDGFGSMAGRSSAHRGFDVLGHGIGTPVPALYGGTVVSAGYYSGILGNIVTVQRTDGVAVSYCHLDTVAVSGGQTIHQGDIIGGLGETGKVTGPHTHVAINPAGAAADPGTGQVVDPYPFIIAARNGDNSGAPGEQPEPAPAAAERTYTVQDDDWLIKIAGEQLGDEDRWREIYELNRELIGENPDLIYPGQVFRLP